MRLPICNKTNIKPLAILWRPTLQVQIRIIGILVRCMCVWGDDVQAFGSQLCRLCRCVYVNRRVCVWLIPKSINWRVLRVQYSICWCIFLDFRTVRSAIWFCVWPVAKPSPPPSLSLSRREVILYLLCVFFVDCFVWLQRVKISDCDVVRCTIAQYHLPLSAPFKKVRFGCFGLFLVVVLSILGRLTDAMCSVMFVCGCVNALDRIPFGCAELIGVVPL